MTIGELVPITASLRRFGASALVTAAGDRASLRFLEFFAANIRNPHTRRAYSRGVGEFLAWCDAAGVLSIAAVQPLHVATWIEAQSRALAAPTAKEQLAARYGICSIGSWSARSCRSTRRPRCAAPRTS